MPLCKELGISFVPFSPLARGLITNTLNTDALADGDFRKSLPRYQKEHQENNNNLVAGFATLARQKQCTPAQLALAWVLAQGDHIMPIPGTKKRKYLEENAAAVNVMLNDADFKAIDGLLLKYPNTGNRYSESNEKLVDRS